MARKVDEETVSKVTYACRSLQMGLPSRPVPSGVVRAGVHHCDLNQNFNSQRLRSFTQPLNSRTFRKESDHFPIERWDVVGLAAGDPAAIADHFLVDPRGAGVLQISFQRRP